jgi:hypothetical protein
MPGYVRFYLEIATGTARAAAEWDRPWWQVLVARSPSVRFT